MSRTTPILSSLSVVGRAASDGLKKGSKVDHSGPRFTSWQDGRRSSTEVASLLDESRRRGPTGNLGRRLFSPTGVRSPSTGRCREVRCSRCDQTTSSRLRFSTSCLLGRGQLGHHFIIERNFSSLSRKGTQAFSLGGNLGSNSIQQQWKDDLGRSRSEAPCGVVLG